MALMGQNYCILFSAVIFLCTGNALPRDKTHTFFNLLQNVEKKIVVEAGFDKLVDENLPKIRAAIITSGMDPMELNDMTLPVTPLPGILKGKIVLTNGWLQQFSHLKRSGKSFLSYSERRLTVEVNLGWKNLTFDYRYLYQYLLYKRNGNVHGYVSDANFQIVFVLNFDTAEIELKNVHFTNTGKYTLELEGHLADKFLNHAIKAIISFAKDLITSKVGKIFTEVVYEAVKEINEVIKPNLTSH